MIRWVSAAWVFVAPGVPTVTAWGSSRAASNRSSSDCYGESAGTRIPEGTWVTTPTGAKSSRV